MKEYALLPPPKCAHPGMHGDIYHRVATVSRTPRPIATTGKGELWVPGLCAHTWGNVPLLGGRDPRDSLRTHSFHGREGLGAADPTAGRTSS